MKEKFKAWLVKNRPIRSKKLNINQIADLEIKLIDKICKKYFPDQNNTEKSWRLLCENIIPIATKYYELSSKNYLLDRVIVWSAIDYFQKNINQIYKKKIAIKATPEVNIYLFHNKQNFFLKSIFLTDVYEYIQYFSTICFGYDFESKNINSDRFNELKIKIEKIIFENNIKEIRNVGFYIKYTQSNIYYFKRSLTHFYNCFMLSSSGQALEQRPEIKIIQKPRPDKLKCYAIATNITCKHPLQIKKGLCFRGCEDCVLQEIDLVEIFNIDRKTIQKNLDTNKIYPTDKIDKDTTELRTYYSVSKTNEYLINFHHPLTEETELYDDVEGYDYWKNKRYILKYILKTGKDAFATLIDNQKVVRDKNNIRKHINAPYIDYFEGRKRYFIPVFQNYVEISKRNSKP